MINILERIRVAFSITVKGPFSLVVNSDRGSTYDSGASDYAIR